jgi:hypothetical protein
MDKGHLQQIANLLHEDVVNSSKENNNKIFNTTLVKKMSEKIPQIIFGGSVGLYLQGIILKRDETDLDIFLPYWVDIFRECDLIKSKIVAEKRLKSGSDFDENACIIFDGKVVKFDLKISPNKHYNIVHVDGVSVKVIDWKEILSYKIKYALNGQSKHEKDLINLIENIHKLKTS